MADNKATIDVKVAAIPMDRWRVFCEIAQWAMDQKPTSDHDATEIGLDLIDMFIRHVSDAGDTPALDILVNAVCQPVEGFDTVLLRDVPNKAKNFIVARTRQVGLPTLADVFFAQIRAADRGDLRISKLKTPPKESADGEKEKESPSISIGL